DLAELLGAVGAGPAVDVDADRAVELADAVDAPLGVEFGPEDDLEESVDDLLVGESLRLGRPPGADLLVLPAGMLGNGGRRRAHHGERRGDVQRSECPPAPACPRASGRPVPKPEHALLSCRPCCIMTA